ncbi:MAG: RsmE family RNA methyltransferase [Acidobacteriota bacterium]|nr:RsmE family RNA methyltransferase [Acidobacteriota bacterium]
MIHLLAETRDLAAETVEVEGADHRHLFRARRLKVGDRVRLVDGRGAARWSVVDQVTARRAVLRVEGAAPVLEPARPVALFVSSLRPERAAWLVEKATELGLRELRWFVSERTSRSLAERALERQRRVAKSALEQSGGAWLPEIGAPVPLEDVPIGAGSVALHPGAATPFVAVAGSAEVVVVGPEGGFSEREIEELAARGAVTAHLGPRVLRTETTAVAALAVALTAMR